MTRPEIIVYRQNNKYGDIYISLDGGKTCYDTECPFDYMDQCIDLVRVDGVPDLVEVWRSGPDA